jgi:hypothetical protein
VSVATARITNIKKPLITSSQRNAWPCEPEGRVASGVGDVPERATKKSGCDERPGQLRAPQ